MLIALQEEDGEGGKALIPLKYMLLCKIMLNLVRDGLGARLHITAGLINYYVDSLRTSLPSLP